MDARGTQDPGDDGRRVQRDVSGRPVTLQGVPSSATSTSMLANRQIVTSCAAVATSSSRCRAAIAAAHSATVPGAVGDAATADRPADSAAQAASTVAVNDAGPAMAPPFPLVVILARIQEEYNTSSII